MFREDEWGSRNEVNPWEGKRKMDQRSPDITKEARKACGRKERASDCDGGKYEETDQRHQRSIGEARLKGKRNWLEELNNEGRNRDWKATLTERKSRCQMPHIGTRR